MLIKPYWALREEPLFTSICKDSGKGDFRISSLLLAKDKRDCWSVPAEAYDGSSAEDFHYPALPTPLR